MKRSADSLPFLASDIMSILRKAFRCEVKFQGPQFHSVLHRVQEAIASLLEVATPTVCSNFCKTVEMAITIASLAIQFTQATALSVTVSAEMVRLVSAPFAVGKSWGARAWTNGPALELDDYILSVVRHSS